MLAGGEDPRYIARRLVRFASEDVGLADPQALTQTLAAWDAYERLGSPEGDLALAQAVIYLGTAPKSNAAYAAPKAAARAAKETGSLMPPAHILNAPTKLMKKLGYGDGYAYDHDAEDGFSGQNYFPDGMERPAFYTPRDRGFERELGRRLDHWAALRAGAVTMSVDQRRSPTTRPTSGSTAGCAATSRCSPRACIQKALPHRTDPRGRQAGGSLDPAAPGQSVRVPPMPDAPAARAAARAWPTRPSRANSRAWSSTWTTAHRA